MHVVWKRPDGFLGAEPSDYKAVAIGTDAKLWLHRSDRSWYPFRIAGGWQEQEATQRLNRLVNLIGKPMSKWVEQMINEHNHSMTDDPEVFYNETLTWLESLKLALKGDTWEVEIMQLAITECESRLKDAKLAFFQSARK